MQKDLQERLVRTIADTIAIARSISGEGGFDNRAAREQIADVRARAHAVINVLGADCREWREAVNTEKRAWIDSAAIVGTLQGIKAAIEGGLLTSIANAALAEAEGDLLEQAKELLDKGYFLPAGVLGRAVLEQHLRKWCERAACTPTKPKPTLDDFKAALYAKQMITNPEQKHVEAMAAVGNLAAHVKPELRQEQVAWLIENVTAFLATHPLP